MIYNTYNPTTELSAFVKCYWTLEAAATTPPEKQRIVPDGCMEMIFHFADPYNQYLADGTRIMQPIAFVFGQITAPLEIEPTGKTGIMAARFHPDGFIPFTATPLREMENRAVPLEELFGNDGKLLTASILQSPSTEEKIRLIESWLLKRLQSVETTDRLARESIDALFQSKGQVSVDELAEQLQVNRRMLERRFSSVIGMSPKQLSKIIRLQATLKLMGQKQFTSLTSLAYETGYYDQAHFIKDFKEFTGVSPKDFYAGNLKMSSLFSGKD
jgi:AraC-like DNA-binding protein